MERKRERVTEEIVEQFWETARYVDIHDMQAVKRYAYTHKCLRLAFWITWNGEAHYTTLIHICSLYKAWRVVKVA